MILPATVYPKKQGTFTNTERRVQLINEVLSPLPGTRADWRILCDVINALGGRADYDSPREISFNGSVRWSRVTRAWTPPCLPRNRAVLALPGNPIIIRARPICMPRPSRGARAVHGQRRPTIRLRHG